MKTPELQRLGWHLFPRYSVLIDTLNRNARLGKWTQATLGLPTFADRADMYRFLVRDFLRNDAIDFLEFGVASGSSLSAWMSLNKSAASRFYGFDSFEGLPEDWTTHIPRGSFARAGPIPQQEDPRLTLVRGLFQETIVGFLRTFRSKSTLVFHHDSDLYSSTLYCLSQCDFLCAAGTVLIFDEFFHPLHEFRAYEDYVASYRRRLRPIAVAKWCGVPQQVAFVFE